MGFPLHIHYSHKPSQDFAKTGTDINNPKTESNKEKERDRVTRFER